MFAILPSWTLKLPESWDHDQSTSEFSLKNAVHANDKWALKMVKQFVVIEAYITGYFCVCFLS